MVHDAFQAYVFSNGFLQPPAGRQHPVAVTQVMMPMLQAWFIWKEAFVRSPMGPGVWLENRWEDREDPLEKNKDGMFEIFLAQELGYYQVKSGRIFSWWSFC